MTVVVSPVQNMADVCGGHLLWCGGAQGPLGTEGHPSRWRLSRTIPTRVELQHTQGHQGILQTFAMMSLTSAFLAGTGVTRGKSGRYGIDASYYNLSDSDEFNGVIGTATIEVISVDDPTAVRILGSGRGTYLSVDYLQLSPYVQIVQPQFVSPTDTDNAYLVSITVLVRYRC